VAAISQRFLPGAAQVFLGCAWQWYPGPCCTVRTRFRAMRRTIQVRIFRGETKYVAECLDLPVVTEADTLDELASNIREAIGLHLEGEDLAELGLAPDPTILATMELDAVA
jgi:predicted RNase H-like HicB family nuclease